MPGTLTHPPCKRRLQLAASAQAYGLDFAELLPGDLPIIRLHLLGKAPPKLDEEQIRITPVGGSELLPIERINGPDSDSTADPLPPPGGFDLVLSCWPAPADYRVEIIEGQQDVVPLDPILNWDTLRIECRAASSVDCLPSESCELPLPAGGPKDYLAKDYDSFRKLLLDRLAVTLPEWCERSPADVAITLVELLAYEADHLSYYQDAIGSEAYLDTCRLRTSLRRHTRLIDYRIHQGCNARAWMHVELLDPESIDWDPQEVFFLAFRHPPRERPPVVMSPERLARWLDSTSAGQVEVFEPVMSRPIRLWRSHNEIELYDWLGARTCLPQGSTSATLVGILPDNPTRDAGAAVLHLQPGDELLLEELRHPRTGRVEEASPGHRHVVRLREISPLQDPLTGRWLVAVHWSRDDALPFSLAIGLAGQQGRQISVARGNLLLVDHGYRMTQDLSLRFGPQVSPELLSPNYPRLPVVAELDRGELTYAAPLPADWSATAVMMQDPRQAIPQVIARKRGDNRPIPLQLVELAAPEGALQTAWQRLQSGFGAARAWRDAFPQTARLLMSELDSSRQELGPADSVPAGLSAVCRRALVDDYRRLAWLPRYDLLGSGPGDRHFVVETDTNGRSQLRFGDGRHGARPPEVPPLRADYRIGSGPAGNFAAEAINQVGFYRASAWAAYRVRNPLPATGGLDPEQADEIRLLAPDAIRVDLQRAVVLTDYERLVRRHFALEIQGAKATQRWTGHETRVLVAIDPWGASQATDELVDRVQRYLRRYVRIGHKVRVCRARRVPLLLSLDVCVDPGAQVAEVRRALDRLYSDGRLPDGTPAFFHPDRFTFGEPVYVSRIVAAAAEVPGVRYATVTGLSRLDSIDPAVSEEGILRLRPAEVALLANDPARPECGRLALSIEGGR